MTKDVTVNNRFSSNIQTPQSSNEILRFIINSGMININDVQDSMEAMKREELLKKHPYKIWQGKDGKWYTYLPDETKKDGRRLVKRKEEKDVKDLVVKYCKEIKEKNRIVTFKEYFEIWEERQAKCGVSEATIDKNNTDFKRFFENDNCICNADIRKIDDQYVEEFIFRTLDRLDIKYRAFQQMFAMMKNIFHKAKIDKVIEVNPCDYIDIQMYKKKCDNSAFEASKRVLNDDGLNKIREILKKDREERPNYIPSYALELALLTGMRAGELSYLKWEHINYKERYIKICGSEKYNQRTKEYHDDTTKTGKERRIPLTEEIKIFFDKLKAVEMKYGYISPYVFSDSRGRIHRGTLCSCARNKCQQAGTTAKGLQVARRTFNSQLRTYGASNVIASSILGHSQEVNEKFYTYDISNMDYKREIVENANKKILGI